MSSLRRSAVTLALAGGVEYGLQLALPIILVRCLDETGFAQYRLLWLLAGTVLALAPAFMPQSLFYFLPRAQSGGERARVIGNTLLYLVVAGLVVVGVLNQWNPWLPLAVRSLLQDSAGLSTIFLMLWVVVAMYDVLPTAETHTRLQANSTIGLALIRTVLLILAAWQTQEIVWVVLALVCVALLKLGLLLYYICRAGRGNRLGVDTILLKRQLSYALPFALGNSLFLMRLQADQWIVASLLAPALYASFSIAAVLQPIATLLRQPVYNAMMPRLNRAYADGDADQMRHLITHSNAATAMLLIPVAGLFWVCAPELVAFVYTERYIAAAPVMQVYLLGMVFNAFAIGHVLQVLDMGRFSTRNSAVCLLLSILLSWLGVTFIGLEGGAFGSVFALAMSEFWSLTVVAKKLEISVVKLLSLRKLLPIFVSTALALGAVLALNSRLSLAPLPLLLIKGSGYVVVWLGCFWLCGGRAQIRGLMKFD